MDDFKLIAKILAAILASENNEVFNCSLIDERTLKTTAEYRDNLILKLKAAGYIDGLYIIDGIGNLDKPVIMWDSSKPSVTLAGMEYMKTSQPLRKAIEELKAANVAVASQVIANKLSGM